MIIIGFLDSGTMICLLNGTKTIKNKRQKAKIKETLKPIAWHPSRWWGWCIPEDEKKRRQKNCGSNR